MNVDLHEARGRRPTVWERIKEAPLNFSVAAAAAIIAPYMLFEQWSALPWWAVLLFGALTIGGAAAAVGRLLDAPHGEAAGLSLLLAAYLCLTLRTLPHVQEGGDLVNQAVNAAALVFGFYVRLLVVKRAIKARRWASHPDRRGDGGE